MNEICNFCGAYKGSVTCQRHQVGRPTAPKSVHVGKRSTTVVWPVMATAKYVDAANLYMDRIESDKAELLESLKAVVREFGWHGSGPLDREEYYCEHCNQHAGNYDETAHLDTCPIRIAKLVIAKAEGKSPS